MRTIEMFAGAGGAALGLEAAGFGHAALCEWDPSACATLRAAGLGPVVEGDVRDLGAIAAVAGGPCDVLWSSFPCQAFSTAGQRLGAEDPRNGWPWTVDAIDRFKPTWLLGENVRGLLLHRGACKARGGQRGLFGTASPESCPGCYFERRILPDLRDRFAHVGWWLLDAADYGIPQHRRRVILWAGPAPLVRPPATHGPGLALPWGSMGEALGLSPCEVYTQRSPETAKGGNRWIPSAEPSATITSASRSQPRPPTAAEDGGLRVGSGLRGSEWGIDRPSPTLRDGNGTAGLYVVAAGVTGAGAPRPLERSAPTIGTKGTAYLLRRPAPTVCGVNGVGLGSAASRATVEAATGRRRLTIEECAILQGFPADHPWQGNSQARYRQVGNAVPPRLAEVVGRALLTAARGTP